MEKPPILKKKQISNAVNKSDENNDEFWMPEDALERVAEAQRDADVEWYRTHWTKEEIESAKSRANVTAIMKDAECADNLQQARTEEREEVAREIFEEIEKPCEHMPTYLNKGGCVLCIQSLKDKYNKQSIGR